MVRIMRSIELRRTAMRRMLTVTIAAVSVLCIAPGALTLSLAVSSRALGGDERPQAPAARDWTRFQPVDRADCLTLIGSHGAYTDLLQCLERKRDARQVPGHSSAPTTLVQDSPRS